MAVLKTSSGLYLVLLLVLLPSACLSVTLYEYFTDGGITSGLTADDRNDFTLNGKNFKILSGSLHYFRVHPDYWRDRLRKYRAAGLNAIDVYIPWNLHEPERGVFDFGDGGRDLSAFLDLPAFIRMAQEEDLFVIFRPGPYICAEWDFGGLPSWLLSEHPMYVRSSFEAYQNYAGQYLRETLRRVKDLQFYTASGSKGGPIIMLQIENEYGAFGYDDLPRDKAHLRWIRDLYNQEGMESLLFTSDSPYLTSDLGSLDEDGVLMTANFKYSSIENLDKLRELQPNRPVLVSEFWPGWFDHWFNPIHGTLSIDEFEEILQNIFNYEGSVNFYMFHGGTNFAFMNGANVFSQFPHYAPTVTSYDYDAPLTEAGHYTAKYDRAAEMLAAYDPLSSLLSKPERPAIVQPFAYFPATMNQYIDFEGILAKVPEAVSSVNLLSMEQLPINGGSGQSYGYINYRKVVNNLAQGSVIVVRGHVRDLLQVMVNGMMIHEPITSLSEIGNFGSFGPSDSSLTVDLTGVPIPDGQISACNPQCTIDFLVENTGRNNYGQPHSFNQKKGLWEGEVTLDGVILTGWEIYPLEFKSNWVQSLTASDWESYTYSEHLALAPRLLRGEFVVPTQVPAPDTFFDFSTDWDHGVVFINGFNLGRYHRAGPTQTLYVPGPILRQGSNEIIIFENYVGGPIATFVDEPDLGSLTKTCSRKSTDETCRKRP